MYNFFIVFNTINGDYMKHYSIWREYNSKILYPKLDHDCSCDVLIIGGGITGISLLYHLRNSKLNVMLVEQNRIGLGVTSNSTGKLTFLQNDLLDKIRSSYNDDICALYLESQIETIHDICHVIDKEEISCDLERVPSSLFTNQEKDIPKMKKLKDFLIQNHISVSLSKDDFIKNSYLYEVDDTYLFHPLKFLYGLLKHNSFPIYEDTSILKMKYSNGFYTCFTSSNQIRCKYVVLASHYPYFLKPYFFPFKVSLEKSYLSCSTYSRKPLSSITYSYPFISMRTYHDFFLYLSNSHSISSDTSDVKHFKDLLKKTSLLGLHPDYLWSNIDIMTGDGLPIIGELNSHLLIGTGYNTWGLTNGFLAGKILSDILKKKDNPYISLFSPKRSFSSISYLDSIVKNMSGYLKGISHSYKCPHMGCGLIYNEIEKTYDCPCHGSRFDSTGKCILSPSNQDISISDK